MAVVVAGFALSAGCGAESPPPLGDAVMDRLAAQGVPPELVYTVELPGYELAEQSVGVVGDEGFGATYVSRQGGQVELRVERGRFTDAMCSDTPVGRTGPPAPSTTCDRDDGGWYRVGGDRHEYVAVRSDHVLRLNGPREDVDRTTLEVAVAAARHVPAADRDTTAPPSSAVERGDLPASGDGAPDNDVGPGG